MKYLLVISIVCMSTFLGFGQTKIKGSIAAAGTNASLPGVSIIIKGTIKGTTSDFDGNYEIIASPADVLVFSYLGYKTKEVLVGEEKSINIVLEEENQKLDEIVIVGYGTQKKSQITGAISSIKNDEFKNKPNANISSSISGKVSGLNVTTPSGTPGAGLLVSVRGNSNPLYVVDGIPMVSESNSAIATSFDTDRNIVGEGQNLSSISDINPNDIESIEVLKDASATSIYGARAANGVILITTKRGKDGKTAISYNTYTGFQKIARNIEFMNAEQFVDLVKEARKNDLDIYNKNPNAFDDIDDFDLNALTQPVEDFGFVLDGTDVDWMDEVSQTGIITNHEISARGGNEKTKFFLSGGYFNQEGVLIENYYKRYTTRLNIDNKINDTFKIGASVSGSFSLNRRSFNDNTYTGVITNVIATSPLMPVYNEDGSYTDAYEYQAYWLSDNPVLSAKEMRAFTRTYRFLGSVFLSIQLTPKVVNKTTASIDYALVRDNQFLSQYTRDASAVGGEALEGTFVGTTRLIENTLNYTDTFSERHTFNLLLGASFQKTVSTQSTAVGQGFPLGSGLENISSAANIISAGSTGTSFSLLSFFGRVNYGLDNKYLLTATLRTDGSSRFSRNKRFGYFPSASLAWAISKEDFFSEESSINNLKLRVSYGITGDQEIGDFQKISFYSPTNYNGASGIKLRNLADPNLSWQRNKTLNIGIDYGLFSNRVSGAFEYFVSAKSDILSEDAIQGTNGFAAVTRNSDEIENKGFEFSALWKVIKTEDFKWNMNFNYTHVKNKIKKLNTDNLLISAYTDLAPTHILRVGEPVGAFWGVDYLGVDPDTGDALFGSEEKIIGQALPTDFGGLTNTFVYKNFDFSLFLRFSFGNEVYNLIRPAYENFGYSSEDYSGYSVFGNNSTNVLDRWRKPGDKAEYPRASFIRPNYNDNSTQFLEDASFVRIQNATLGYTFKNTKLFSNLRVYLEGQNLFLFSDYKGFDPEVSSTGGADPRTAGIDYGAYPQARTVLLGLNVGL